MHFLSLLALLDQEIKVENSPKSTKSVTGECNVGLANVPTKLLGRVDAPFLCRQQVPKMVCWHLME